VHRDAQTDAVGPHNEGDDAVLYGFKNRRAARSFSGGGSGSAWVIEPLLKAATPKLVFLDAPAHTATRTPCMLARTHGRIRARRAREYVHNLNTPLTCARCSLHTLRLVGKLHAKGCIQYGPTQPHRPYNMPKPADKVPPEPLLRRGTQIRTGTGDRRGRAAQSR